MISRLDRVEKELAPRAMTHAEIIGLIRQRAEEYKVSPLRVAESFASVDRMNDNRTRILGPTAHVFTPDELLSYKRKHALQLIKLLREQSPNPGSDWPALVRDWNAQRTGQSSGDAAMDDPIFAGLYLELLSIGIDKRVAESFASFCVSEFRRINSELHQTMDYPPADIRSYFLSSWFDPPGSL